MLNLIPKEVDATELKKFRLIALINCSFKIFSKALNNRLVRICDRLIAPNQTAFIKGRYILESVVAAHEIAKKGESGIILTVIRGVAHLFPGTRYLPLRLKLVQMLNELSTCSQMFFPIPSLRFDGLEFREVSQKEQTQKTKVNFSSLLKVCHLH
jgi:hypothetical protein